MTRSCETCRERQRCMALQMANQRANAWLHGFARPDCEAELPDDALEPVPMLGAGMTSRVRYALASGPMTTEQIIDRLKLGEIRGAGNAVGACISNMAYVGKIQRVGQTKNRHNRTVGIYALTET